MNDVTNESYASSRRAFLKVILATGATVAGAGALGTSAFAQATPADTTQTIINLAATAEELAVLFYTNALSTAVSALKINDQDKSYLQAALVEEQIHLNFLLKSGAQPVTSTFSLPASNVFTDATAFVTTLTTLETAFVSAYNAAVYEFAQAAQHDLARVAGMIGSVEAQHYALGRVIGEDLNVANTTPANNWGFAPQIIPSVGAAVPALTAAGVLSPTTGNSFNYQAIDLTASPYVTIATGVMYQSPYVAPTVPLAATPYYPSTGVHRGERPE